jgi:hypothetical protein
MMLYVLLALVALGVVLLGASVRVITQFERGIVLRFGRLSVSGPGHRGLHGTGFGPTAPLLLSKSRGAQLLVLGSRSPAFEGRLRGRLAPSVCGRVATRASALSQQ